MSSSTSNNNKNLWKDLRERWSKNSSLYNNNIKNPLSSSHHRLDKSVISQTTTEKLNQYYERMNETVQEQQQKGKRWLEGKQALLITRPKQRFLSLFSGDWMAKWRSTGRQTIRRLGLWSLAAIAVYGVATTLPSEVVRQYYRHKYEQEHQQQNHHHNSQRRNHKDDDDAATTSGLSNTIRRWVFQLPATWGGSSKEWFEKKNNNVDIHIYRIYLCVCREREGC